MIWNKIQNERNVQCHSEWARIYGDFTESNWMEIFWSDLWLFPDDAIANTMNYSLLLIYIYLYKKYLQCKHFKFALATNWLFTQAKQLIESNRRFQPKYIWDYCLHKQKSKTLALWRKIKEVRSTYTVVEARIYDSVHKFYCL